MTMTGLHFGLRSGRKADCVKHTMYWGRIVSGVKACWERGIISIGRLYTRVALSSSVSSLSRLPAKPCENAMPQKPMLAML
jgi:hypothetical protein